MGRSNEKQQAPQQDPNNAPDTAPPAIKDPPSDLPNYADPIPPQPQDPQPPTIKSNNRYDPNDRLNYIREPSASLRYL